MNLSTFNNSKVRTLTLQSRALSGATTYSLSGNTWTPLYFNNMPVYSSSILDSYDLDLYYTNTSLWLQMDGTLFSTSFVDSSQSKWTIIRSGNTFINGTPYKLYGTGTGYFDGSGDLEVANSSNNIAFQLGSGDFTLEAWIYPESINGDFPIISKYGTDSLTQRSYSFNVRVDRLSFYYNNIGPIDFGGFNNVQLNQWQHIALTRQGNNFRAFVNGIQIGSTFNPGAISLVDANSTNVRIGGSVLSMTKWFGGMDEVKITKGVARYTSNFTPPSLFYVLKPGYYIATIEMASQTVTETGVVFRLRDFDNNRTICQWTNTRIGPANTASIAPQTAFRQTVGFTLTSSTRIILEALGGGNTGVYSVSDGDNQTYAQLTLDKIG